MAVQKQNRVVALHSKQTRQSSKPSDRLATFKQSKEWTQLTRPVQLSYEKNDLRSDAIEHAISRFGEAVADLRDSSIASLRGTLGEWEELIGELGEETGEEVRVALDIQKRNELAAHLTAHQSGLDTLNEMLDEDLEEIKARPGHAWTKPTVADVFEDVFSGGESKMVLRGLPPLTFKESALNFFTAGSVAAAKIRQYERARLGVTQDDDEEGDILDADWSSK